MTGTVFFERSGERRYMARPFTLLIDGIAVGMVWRGRSIEVEAPAGLHDAIAEMDDFQSAPLRFRVRDQERVHIRCSPNPKARFTAPWWSLLSRRMQVRHQRVDDPTGAGVVLLELVEAPEAPDAPGRSWQP
jgi:hypothetical protein